MHAFFQANAPDIGHENYFNKAKAPEFYRARSSAGRSTYAGLW
jgi:hypothetical protein